jgi:hypothetical protein
MTSPAISSLMFPYSFPTAKTRKYVVFRRAPKTEQVNKEIKRGNITTKRENQLRENDRHINRRRLIVPRTHGQGLEHANDIRVNKSRNTLQLLGCSNSLDISNSRVTINSKETRNS